MKLKQTVQSTILASMARRLLVLDNSHSINTAVNACATLAKIESPLIIYAAVMDILNDIMGEQAA